LLCGVMAAESDRSTLARRRARDIPRKGPSVPNVSPTQWADGLSREEQYIWLCDCYRLRRFDEQTEGDRKYLALFDFILKYFSIFFKKHIFRKSAPFINGSRHFLAFSYFL
jgi:hypothetical protein